MDPISLAIAGASIGCAAVSFFMAARESRRARHVRHLTEDVAADLQEAVEAAATVEIPGSCVHCTGDGHEHSKVLVSAPCLECPCTMRQPLTKPRVRQARTIWQPARLQPRGLGSASEVKVDRHGTRVRVINGWDGGIVPSVPRRWEEE